MNLCGTIHRCTFVIVLVLMLAVGCVRGPVAREPEALARDANVVVARVLPASATFRDPQKTPEDRAADLLVYLTLEEKVGQMTQVARDYLVDERDIARYGLGSVLSGGGSAPVVNTPQGWADMYDRYQGQSPAIPLLYGIDSVHGNNNLAGAVIFPHNIGLGASGDPILTERVARITAMETAATGIRWTFAPCLAVPQDERWGRTYEGYGEDPALVALLGAAAIRGLQGDPDRSQLDENSFIMATAKHFIGDGGTTGGVDQGDVAMDEATLRKLFLVPYEAALQAGVGSVMVSFSSWNGMKMHQQAKLISGVLKGELGFDGFVVSDWAGLKQLPGTAADQIELAINAGIDMVMVPDTWKEFITDLLALVRTGKISQKRIDDAVYRILVAKFRLGLFEQPFADRSLIPLVGSTAHRDVARQAVRESLVVLKNDGILPLETSSGTIGVVGSAASDVGAQCGGWTLSWQGQNGPVSGGTTILDGLRAVGGNGVKITYSNDAAGLGPVDVAIVVAAEKPYAEMKGDDPKLTFPESTAKAVTELVARGIPVVVVLLSGRPLVLGQVLTASSAFVAAWLPGTEGAGVAEILFGKYKPTGKLSYTWFKTVDDLPINATNIKAGVLFPNGYGLSW